MSDDDFLYDPSIVQQIHAYGLDTISNEIYLDGTEHYGSPDEPGVEFTMANKFIRNLNILQRNSASPITIHMKTGGGCVYEGFAIYDSIKQCINETIIINYTTASSMSSVILQAADFRFMMPHSTVMFHMASGGIYGSVDNIKQAYESIDGINESMLDIYTDRLRVTGEMKGKSRKYIKKWLTGKMGELGDVFLSAEAAISIGFADELYVK